MNRPGGVTVIAVLCFIFGAIYALGGAGMMAGGGMVAKIMSEQGQSAGPLAGMIAGLGAAIGICLLLLGIVDFVLGVCLLQLKEWARIVSIVLAGIGAALGVLGLLQGLVHFILFATIIRLCVLAVEVWIVIYLLKPEVKAAFQGAQARAASV
jgi:hypothetical protein